MKTLPITDFIYDKNTGRVFFQVKLPEDSTNTDSLYLINRDGPKYVPPKRITIEPQIIGEGYKTFEFNLDDVFSTKEITHDSVWYLICEMNDEQYQCKLDEGDFDYTYLKHKEFFKVKPYLTKHSTVAFFVSNIEVNVILSNISYEAGRLFGELEINLEKPLDKIEMKLGVKDRQFNSVQVINTIDKMKTDVRKRPIEVPITSTINKLKNEHVLDIYLMVNGTNCNLEQKVLVKPNTKKNFGYCPSEINEFYSIKPYVTKENTLAFFIRKHDIVPQINDVLFNEETGQFSVEGILAKNNQLLTSSNYEAVSIIFKQRNPVGKSDTYIVEASSPLDITGTVFSGAYKINEVLPEEKINLGNLWDVFIGIKSLSGKVEEYPVVMAESYKKKNYGYYHFNTEKTPKSIKPYINGLRGISLFFTDNNKIKKGPVKIAILGTCFSRNPFNSMPYFNPQYKDLYEVVFTQFHSSLISLASNPVEFNDDDFGKLENTFIPFVKRDFYKSFYEDLKSSNPDYLILDLDIDATHNLVKVSEDQVVTLTYMLAKTNYLKKNQDQLKYIVHDNDEEYFELWKTAADKFVDKLIEIIPPERIILTAGRYAEKYIDTNKKVQTFPRLEWIRERNDLWEKLDGYFLAKVPQAHCINLTKTKFIGDEQYPLGNKAEPPHYQSGYYKEFLKQLNEIVINNIPLFRR
ncbi:MAG: DUF6270 domain-containing protein [Bacillota bacterium]